MGARHSSRGELAGEHALTDIGQLVIFIVFMVTCITDTFFFHYSVFLAIHVPAYIRVPVGLAVLFVSTLLALSAHQVLFGNRRDRSGVITTRVFSLVRHPLYFGSWLFSFGLVITTFSLASGAVSLGLLLFYYRVARYEERLLIRKFGGEYREYQSRVAMLFPIKLRRKQHAKRTI
jgi:protein-S-isoprenylcysteine O-methyltransferase Ste14